jgi:hypothetical protein
MINDIQHAQRPTTQKEADAIAEKMPFSYRAALGELIYAYVTCRPDIGYAIALLAKYSNNPAEIHFEAVKDVYRYLRRTKDDGIIFWRTQRRDDTDLPDGTEVTRPIDEDDALVPHPAEADQLGAYFDAAYATCPATRRSTGAFVITLGGSVIYYKAKWMPTVATSSTEAEFMAAVNCAKAVKYFRSILNELGVKQNGPTPASPPRGLATSISSTSPSRSGLPARLCKVLRYSTTPSTAPSVPRLPLYSLSMTPKLGSFEIIQKPPTTFSWLI